MDSGNYEHDAADLTQQNLAIDTTASESALNDLLCCPFCGGKVVESIPSWNIAHAECTKCGETWGHCGSRFYGRYDKWNKRATS